MTPSPATCLARALRLLDPTLSELAPAQDGAERDRIATALLDRGEVDEQHTARDLADALLACDADPLDGLFALAVDLVTFHHGIPRCADSVLWHRVGFEMDADLLVAARLATHPDHPSSRDAWIRALAWPSVLAVDGFFTESVLSREVADTHVHLGGALPGSFYWIACMSGFARVHRMKEWAPADPERWIEAITRAQRLRSDLAGELLGIDTRLSRAGTSVDPFFTGPEEPFCDPLLERLLPEPALRAAFNPSLGERFLLWQALAVLWNEPQHPARPYVLDYIRLRTSFIHHLVHGPGCRGLDRFVTVFHRHHLIFDDRQRGTKQHARRWRKLQRASIRLESFRVRHMLRYEFSDPTDAPWARDLGAGLEADPIPSSPWRPPRQIEIRVTPVPGRSQMRVLHAYLRGLADFVQYERDAPPVRVGFVFHVHKRHGETLGSDLACRQLEGLLSILDDVPELRPFVVGIDAAGAEMATSPRDLSRAFRIVQRYADDRATQPGVPPVRLGKTCHAGEDFRDLLTGVRYVDEAVELLGLAARDRIGHGLALAIDPREWYAPRRATYPLRRDRLLDLLWGCHVARESSPRDGLHPDVDLDTALRLQISALLPRLERGQLDEILEAYADTARFPTEAALLESLGLAHPAEPHHLEAAGLNVDLAIALRARALKRVARAQVVIEACPTSNLIIGGFASYDRLPYLALNHAHLSGAPEDDPQIPLSINTDDPGVFQTTVANEYRLLAEALARAGFRRREVAAWLDEARRVGIESSFIPPWSPPTRPELLHALAKLGIRAG